jgi:hypothetical protein
VKPDLRSERYDPQEVAAEGLRLRTNPVDRPERYGPNELGPTGQWLRAQAHRKEFGPPEEE